MSPTPILLRHLDAEAEAVGEDARDQLQHLEREERERPPLSPLAQDLFRLGQRLARDVTEPWP